MMDMVKKPETINQELMRFIENSPCAFYAIANLKRELEDCGFRELKETEAWSVSPGGRYYVSRNGSSLISFILPEGAVSSFHIIASHSDSPSFKIKPGPALRSGCGLLRASVEKYGGPIESTWFDRPLSVSGRVLIEDGDGLSERLVFPEKLTLMLPSVAPHLLRKEEGTDTINPENRMFPVIGVGDAAGLLWEILARELGVSPEQILSSDLYLCNREKARLWGAGEEFLSAPRLDDLACAYGSFLGFLDAKSCDRAAAVHCVFDSEEIGSRTPQGADASFLRDVLERICLSAGLNREQFHRTVAESLLISADSAHAVHPNFEQLSDPENRPCLNRGLVLKFQAGQRYATDAVSAAVFKQICRKHELPVQEFTNRQGSRGGTTLGNLSVSQVPLRTVDIGLPQLAMHSCYETIGASDPAVLAEFSRAFYQEPLPRVKTGK